MLNTPDFGHALFYMEQKLGTGKQVRKTHANGLVTKTKALYMNGRLFEESKQGLHFHNNNNNYKLHPLHLSHTIITAWNYICSL